MKKQKLINERKNVEVEINDDVINQTIDDLIFKFRGSDYVDCELVRVMDIDDFMALLYNLATNIFDRYRYSNIPYKQYNNGMKHKPITILHNIKYNEVNEIKRKLCQ